MLQSLTSYLTPDRMQSVLSALRFMFYFSALATILLHMLRTRSFPRTRHRMLFVFPLLFLAAAAAIVVYQATWQLAGYTRRDFVRFMERYNPRTNNAAGHLVRGSILDRRGNILAETDPTSTNFRNYPYAEATAHIVGFRHPTEGLTGIENAADTLLSGYLPEGENTLRITGQAALQKSRGSRHIGTNVVLTIDADLQLYAHMLMNGRKGAVVGIDPRDGAIRILLSSPSFDPNNYKRALNIDPDAPLLNRALHGRYPPGSTFKTAIAGLAVECRIPLSIFCPADGYYAPGARRPIRDHEYYSYLRQGLQWPGFGMMDLDRAFAKSSNTYFASAGVSCGVQAFNDLAKRLRFDERIPIFGNGAAIVSSQRGNIPELGAGERRELSQISIGQGRLTTTPLHMAMMVAAIANDGEMVKPRISEGEPRESYGPLFSRKTALRVQQAMRTAVVDGTGRKADLPGLEVCGKTGTAQNPGGEDHAWFVCFAPRENPTLALAVIVENAGYGSAAALPIAVEILKENAANERVNAKEAW